VIEWEEAGIIVGRRRLPRGALVLAHTPRRGLVRGMVYGIRDVARCSTWLTGNLVAIQWTSRSQGGLGTLTGTTLASPATDLHGSQPERLMALGAAASLVGGLADGHPQPRLHAGLLEYALRDVFGPLWLLHYLRFELGFISEAGFAPPHRLLAAAAKAGRFDERIVPDKISCETRIPDADLLPSLRWLGTWLGRHLPARGPQALPVMRRSLEELCARRARGDDRWDGSVTAEKRAA